jgi:potassium efflux system protein
MLLDAAEAHGDVLKKPPPNVLVQEARHDDDGFRPDLRGWRCRHRRPRHQRTSTTSSTGRLGELETPVATELTVKGLEGVEHSLGEIAAAVSKEVGRRAKPAGGRVSVKRSGPPPETEDEPEEAPAPPPAKPEPAATGGKDETKD